MKQKKILIYSHQGTACIDLRIQSQAVFLKNMGYKVLVLDKNPFGKYDDRLYKQHNVNIKPIYVKSSLILKALRYANAGRRLVARKLRSVRYPISMICLVVTILSEALYLVAILFYVAILRPILQLILYNAPFYNPYDSYYKTILRGIKDFAPDVIIARDISGNAAFYKQKIDPSVVIINDLHEIFYLQGESVNLIAKFVQEEDFKYTNGIICVNDLIADKYYNTWKSRGLAVPIPNVICNQMLENMQSPQFKTTEKVNFLYHGGYSRMRNSAIYLINIWDKLDKKAVLNIRLLNYTTADSQYLLEEVHKTKSFAEKRIVILETTFGGVEQEVVSTIDMFDVGIDDTAVHMDNQYRLASANRLSTYLHSGLALMTTNGLFSSYIVNKSQAGVVFDYQNPDDMIEKINNLCQNPEQLLQMRKNAYNFAKTEFNYEVYGKNLVEMIEKLSTKI